MGHFVEQEAGIGKGREGVGVEEGGGDVDVREEVGFEEVGVEVVNEDGALGRRGAGFDGEDGCVGAEGGVVLGMAGTGTGAGTLCQGFVEV